MCDISSIERSTLMVILCIVSLNGSHCYFFVLVAEFDILEYLCETYSVGRFFFFMFIGSYQLVEH